MARWLRFANTLGALELLAADVCAAAAARPHCLAPDDLARQFILLSRALHLFVDRARSPASLGAVRYRRRRLGVERLCSSMILGDRHAVRQHGSGRDVRCAALASGFILGFACLLLLLDRLS